MEKYYVLSKERRVKRGFIKRILILYIVIWKKLIVILVIIVEIVV